MYWTKYIQLDETHFAFFFLPIFLFSVCIFMYKICHSNMFLYTSRNDKPGNHRRAVSSVFTTFISDIDCPFSSSILCFQEWSFMRTHCFAKRASENGILYSDQHRLGNRFRAIFLRLSFCVIRKKNIVNDKL